MAKTPPISGALLGEDQPPEPPSDDPNDQWWNRPLAPDPRDVATAKGFMAGGSGAAPAMTTFPKDLTVENLVAFAKTPAGKALIQSIYAKTKKAKG